MGVAEQAYRKRDAKASMARQGGLRPNMRHVQRGSEPSRLSSTLLVKPNPVSRFPPSVIKDGWGGRSFCSDGLRSDINEDHAEHGPAQAYVVKGTKCAIALVAQSDSERWSTEPEVAGSNPAEGTRNRKLFRCLSSASCSPCVGSLTAEYRSPKPVGVRSRLTRRARTVLFGSLLTHGFVKPNDTVPPGSDRRLKDFLFSSAVRPEPSPHILLHDRHSISFSLAGRSG